MNYLGMSYVQHDSMPYLDHPIMEFIFTFVSYNNNLPVSKQKGNIPRMFVRVVNTGNVFSTDMASVMVNFFFSHYSVSASIKGIRVSYVNFVNYGNANGLFVYTPSPIRDLSKIRLK